jgi:hypothetical protein
VVKLRAAAPSGVSCWLHLDPAAELRRAIGPGLPGTAEPATFYLQRVRAAGIRLVSVIEPVTSAPFVRGWSRSGDVIEVETAVGVDRHVNTSDGWDVTTEGIRVPLRGLRRAPVGPDARPLIDPNRPTPATGVALSIHEHPTLDGTLDAFDFSAPLELDHEDQYRRSEEPYAGPEEFSAVAALGWDQEVLYVGVEVRKPELVIRSDAAPSLRLDNDPDDIHADGIQVYVRTATEQPAFGFLIVPSSDDGGIRVRVAGGASGDPGMVRGAWRPTEQGYAMTVAITLPGWEPRPEDEIAFDLLVNRIEPGRERRSGQLVWSGGGGWVYLRGDRQDPAGFGVLELR